MNEPTEKVDVNKVFEQGGSLAVVIPSDIAKAMNINKGTHLKIYSEGEKKKKLIMEVIE